MVNDHPRKKEIEKRLNEKTNFILAMVAGSSRPTHAGLPRIELRLPRRYRGTQPCLALYIRHPCSGDGRS